MNSGVICVLKIGNPSVLKIGVLENPSVLTMVGSSSTVDNGSPVTYRVHPSIDPLA